MKTLAGQLLISSPLLKDSNFDGSLVLIIRHDEEGAFGLIVNRPAALTVAEVWKQLSHSPCSTPCQLYIGGPCPGPLMALHNHGLLSEFEVLPELYFSADPAAISQLVVADDKETLFFAGYAGWSEGQLEQEIEAGAWYAQSVTASQLQSDSPLEWDDCLKQARRQQSFLIDVLNIREIPSDPSNN
ncbi:MAG: YqgE/AlgH family protein [Planctomycetota bacterium]|nr:YqgE/AlgH family protein [Planctomycetota bacterium]